jgi:hypothetical protein
MRKFVTIGIAVAILMNFYGFSLAEGTNPKPNTLSQEHRKPIQLTQEQRDEIWNTYFTDFYWWESFAYGQINDDQLIGFALAYITKNNWDESVVTVGYTKMDSPEDADANDIASGHAAPKLRVAAKDVDAVTNKYFGKVAASHHSIPGHPFDGGYYEVGFLAGGVSFSKLQNLYDNGDGTYTAIVYIYGSLGIRPKEFRGLIDNGDGTYTAMGIHVDEQGNSKKWYQKNRVDLYAEYKAVVKAVCEGGNKRYIMLEYEKEHDFMINRDGRLFQRIVPNPLPKEE